MRKSLLPLLGIAFGVAILATALFYGLFLSKIPGNAASSGPPVLVAARNLERGAVLKAEDVKVANWSGSIPLKGALSDPAQVAGMSLLAPVEENEPLTERRLASPKDGGGLGIATGMRAVSVHVVDSAGVVNMLRPGHKVDVQVVGAPESRNQEDVRIQTILQNVEVLAVSTQTENSTGKFPGQVVTLLTTPAEADMLGLADSLARIRLTLRNPLDEQRNRLPAVTLPALFYPRRANTPGPPPAMRAGAKKAEALPDAPARLQTAGIRPPAPPAGEANRCPSLPPSCR